MHSAGSLSRVLKQNNIQPSKLNKIVPSCIPEASKSIHGPKPSIK